MTRLALAAAALTLAAPALAQVPTIDTSPVKGMTPADAARRALGSVAAGYHGPAVVEFPIAGDPPPANAEPDEWAVMFFTTPKAVAPGICHVDEYEVGVARGSPYRTEPNFGTLRAVTLRPHLVYRIVGPVAATADAPPDAATAKLCGALLPVEDQFLDRDPFFPGAPGAFDAASHAEAWQTAALAQRFARGTGMPRTDCVSGGSSCDAALKALRADPIPLLYRVDTRACASAALGELCLELALMITADDVCILRFGTMRADPLEVRSVRLGCGPRDRGGVARRVG